MTTVDLDAIREEYLKQCGPHDFGLVEYGCNCPSGEPRWAIQRLADEVERLRQELDEARAELAERDLIIDRVHAAEKAFLSRAVDAKREVARLRPVVEAAEAWAHAPFASNDMPGLTRDLVNAVDAFRSATPDAEPAPRVWHLPPEPGLEVTRVLDAYGQYFERQHDEHPGDDVWIGQTFAGDVDVDDLMLEWPLLMAYHAPITDATPAPGVPVDTEATP